MSDEREQNYAERAKSLGHPACGSCQYYEHRMVAQAAMGQCRRYAPRPEIRDEFSDPNILPAWPEVATYQDWCGEYLPYAR